MSGGAPAGVRVRTDESGPYEVVWLDNGHLRLGVVPRLGGRLLSLVHEGAELLWRNPELLDDRLHPVGGHRPAPTSGPMANWANYGGDKTWPAPQGWLSPREWAGPPDPVLDSGPYTAAVREWENGAAVTLESGHDPRTGLRIRREIRLDAGRASYELRLTAVNESSAPVRWALWNVTQYPGGGVARVEVAAGSADPVELAVGTAAPAWMRAGADAADGTELLEIPAQDVVGKLGFPGATGRLTYARDGRLLTTEWDVPADAEYPDGGSRAEVWMEHPLDRPLEHLGGLNPPARIVECEALGPWTRLDPGAGTSLGIRVRVEAP
ncbi:hypothetical protein Acsp04_24540 [Actinomadura sp. NBRC 104425]|uniref:DUF4380 domain-containing protein n=1 Tax=Actinomadura sp. NBRC 104425 TaxID=3032204 RepID=UPI0024A2574F|nr:DUF4380 domain-containing protein [Actinomadura sp. NBRC 104425]GLZ12219.1 hypothetical protein Acsp04_24540 [Actinomadura sp. NBRC 104425]